jgi:hypothetical protein
LLYYRFDSPALGKAVSDAVAKATGAQLQASSFSLQIAGGLTARDLKLTSETPGARMSIHMDELVLQRSVRRPRRSAVKR